MNTDELKAMFNQAIAATTNADTIAKMEVLREYFTNTEFRAKLEEYSWQQTQDRK